MSNIRFFFIQFYDWIQDDFIWYYLILNTYKYAKRLQSTLTCFLVDIAKSNITLDDEWITTRLIIQV